MSFETLEEYIEANRLPQSYIESFRLGVTNAILRIQEIGFQPEQEIIRLSADISALVELIENISSYRFIGGEHSILSKMLTPNTLGMNLVHPIGLDEAVNFFWEKAQNLGTISFNEISFELKRSLASSLKSLQNPKSNIILVDKNGIKTPWMKPSAPVGIDGMTYFEIESVRTSLRGGEAAQQTKKDLNNPDFIMAIERIAFM